MCRYGRVTETATSTLPSGCLWFILEKRMASDVGDAVDNEVSGWAIGWTAFAGIMMVISGFWWIMAGIVALANDTFYVVGPEYIFQFDVTTWGWIHLLLGIAVLVAGFYLFSGAVWARTIGVVISGLWALVAFAWLPWYPVWALLLIAVAVSVIWALTAHGRDLADTRAMSS